jgi:hypothetical protein
VLADLNALIAFGTRHAYYFDADPTDPGQVLSDISSGNTRYLTLKREHLPLLEPLYAIGILDPILDAVEPALRYVIDLAYDRTVSPAAPTRISWTPIRRDPVQVIRGFVDAVDGNSHAVPAPISEASTTASSTRAASIMKRELGDLSASTRQRVAKVERVQADAGTRRPDGVGRTKTAARTLPDTRESESAA